MSKFSLFGPKKNAPAGPTAEEQCTKRAEELGGKIAALNEKADYLDKQITRLKGEALTAHKAKQATKAKQLVSRFKALEKQQTQTWAICQNLQAGLDQIQQAVMNIDAIQALKQNTELLKNLMKQNGLDPEKIDQIQDDAAEIVQQMYEISRIVATPIGGQMDDFDVDDEMRALEDELDGEEVQVEPVRVGPGPAPARAAPADSGFEELLEAFG
jgi:hypothetical protein